MSDVTRALEAIPFADGSFRRRILAGVFLMAGIPLFSVGPVLALHSFIATLPVVNDLISTPLIGIAALLGLYAIGTLAELSGDIVVLPALAAVALYAQAKLTKPMQTKRSLPEKVVLAMLVVLSSVLLVVLKYALIGLLVVATAIDLLWQRKYSVRMYPDQCRRIGLSLKQLLVLKIGFGDDFDFAFTRVLHLFRDRGLASVAARGLNRLRDVAVVLVVAVLILVFASMDHAYVVPRAFWKFASAFSIGVLVEDVPDKEAMADLDRIYDSGVAFSLEKLRELKVAAEGWRDVLERKHDMKSVAAVDAIRDRASSVLASDVPVATWEAGQRWLKLVIIATGVLFFVGVQRLVRATLEAVEDERWTRYAYLDY